MGDIKKESEQIYNNYKTELEPIKIIYKYKNNNNKKCYLMYIYVGNHGYKYKKIFDKMKKLTIKDTIIELSTKEQDQLEKEYGELWLKYFFNIQHIAGFINKLKKDKKLYNEIKGVKGDKWVDNFINKFSSEVVIKKINYSYGELVKQQYERKLGKNIELLETDEYEKELQPSNYSQNILYEMDNILEGGNPEEDDADDIGMFEEEAIIDDAEEELKYEEEQEMHKEDITLEELEKIYQTDEIDENIKKTSEMISKALKDDDIIEKKSNTMIAFDDSNIDDTYDQELSEVYKKNFVYEHFIYKDDTIKTLRNKITVTIKNNKQYGEYPYIIPSRMYLWSEYVIDGKLEKVMLGTKWLRKNNVFDIPIEPLDLKYYINKEDPIKKIADELQLLGSRIKVENEDNNILYEYDDYILNNEIFMLDIYNEIGINTKIKGVELRNLSDIYIKLYFSRVKIDDIQGIINYLTGEKTEENKIIKNTFDTIYNDLIMEREICNIVDEVRDTNRKEYQEYFKIGNAITLSDINIFLDIHDDLLYREYENDPNHIHIPKLDLFRIFNDFELSTKFPFLQYHMANEQIVVKYDEEYMIEFSKQKENLELMSKWFEHAGYGISFKVRIKGDKFMSISLNEIGKIEYKTQWKEDDLANIGDVYDTYEYVKDLVKIINKILKNHPRKMKIREPEDHEFKFAFINGIQRFTLPSEKQINHNELSDFCAFFYPYVALIVEPAKRVGKLTKLKEDVGKYGTYLKYKRIPRYDNTFRIEQRILSYLKNYDISDELLIDEIAKQFNLTQEVAKQEIERVKSRVGAIDKINKKLKNFDENIPRIRGPGRSIEIQGKTIDKYKIRISGARDKKELERIIEFVNILLYLYYETYILKKSERQIIRDKLKKLTNIARRRSKVAEYVDYKKEQSNVKLMKQLDKKRLGFKSDEGKGWVRACQNSGTDKQRRPEQIKGMNVKELINNGYKLNKKTGDYEKEVFLTKKSKVPIILKALKTIGKDDNGATEEMYYTCDPMKNGEHMYVGFLTKSVNPFGQCMPCCFKKNIMETPNKDKQTFFTKCKTSEAVDTKNKPEDKPQSTSGDILYILLDNVKVPEGRISYLPKYIDILINYVTGKDKKIKNNYLSLSNGYFFKGGIKQEDYVFLDTLSYVLHLEIPEIKLRIKNFLKKDKEETYYTSLNSGDIRNEYRIGDFIKFIESTDKIDYYYLKDLLLINNLFRERGILPIVLYRENLTIKTGNVDQEEKKEDFFLEIDNNMVIEFEYYKKMIKEKDLLIMIHDGKYYYPIVQVYKTDVNAKTITINKIVLKDNDSSKTSSGEDQLVDQIYKLFKKTVEDVTIDNIKTNMTAHEIEYVLQNINNKEYEIKGQVIDARYKCRYIVCKNDCIIPVIPSAVISNIPMICMSNHDEGACISKLELIEYNKMIKLLNNLVKESDNSLNIKPIGLFYSEKDNNMITLSGIMTSNNDIIPIKVEKININEIDKELKIENRPLYQELDQKIINYNKYNVGEIDKRIENVNYEKYKEEGYQLFRYEISTLINKKNNKEMKDNIIKYLESDNLDKIKKILIEKSSELIKIIENLPDLTYYQKQNNRIICNDLPTDKCEKHPHCIRIDDKCKVQMTDNMLNEYIDKLTNEMYENEYKRYEILQMNNNYVDNIVDHNYFTERKGQKIIKSTNINLNKELQDLFGKDAIPKLGKRFRKRLDVDLQQLYLENPLKDIKTAYIQTIIPQNYSIIRGYVNGYYWIKHELYDTISRNLGYYSEMQNEMVNLCRSIIIDWLNIQTNIDRLLEMNLSEFIYNKIVSMKKNNFNRNIVNEYIIELIEKYQDKDFGIFELLILNDIHKIPITLSLNGNAKYYINDLKIRIIKSTDDDDYNKFLNTETICINLICDIEKRYVSSVESFYFMLSNK